MYCTPENLRRNAEMSSSNAWGASIVYATDGEKENKALA